MANPACTLSQHSDPLQAGEGYWEGSLEVCSALERSWGSCSLRVPDDGRCAISRHGVLHYALGLSV